MRKGDNIIAVDNRLIKPKPQELPVDWSVIIEVSQILIPFLQSIISLFDVKVPAFLKYEGVFYFLTIRWTKTSSGLGVEVGYIDDNGNPFVLREGLKFIAQGKKERQTKKALRELLKFHNVI